MTTYCDECDAIKFSPWCDCPRPRPASYLIGDEVDPDGNLTMQFAREIQQTQAWHRTQLAMSAKRHPRKSYVKTMRPGKRMPMVVIADELRCKGVGHIDAGDGRQYLVKGALVIGKGNRSFSFGTSDWTMFGYGGGYTEDGTWGI